MVKAVSWHGSAMVPTVQPVPVGLCVRLGMMPFSTVLALDFSWVAACGKGNFISEPCLKSVQCAQGTTWMMLTGREVVVISGTHKGSSWAKRETAAAMTFLMMLHSVHSAQCAVVSCWDLCEVNFYSEKVELANETTEPPTVWMLLKYSTSHFCCWGLGGSYCLHMLPGILWTLHRWNGWEVKAAVFGIESSFYCLERQCFSLLILIFVWFCITAQMF